ncbi:MAG: ABC transporter [Bdellovibrionales bacterium RIFOXYD12_FULL_39_22]|nr:MAG: ABC transporter [Bdellovibrionales bacterium RIFOXYB1_FULL_39_21]OFZ41050.1 MAG: ABC transporter [Bdellovibrionales bacterium RIFOXYC12_FULL_39_17]OFZ50263.1 MAG: ABC transporter [Bdellovibrionales bacterium RIFOXYC1_FULL_39_130]OFZ73338.1 MAG: ABC transporter [Bdellovibrionales bacterium RIFOXYC2_FULL_39_8]OFZ75064.1 MAG: ABC transporter [Bdellovibrionales bacterium RIFOXYD1_FULL_39_84]OFZ92294.1 MAG: ABC transporter [Bdellovibrionales bacterium RIFOXYD12_FULL_39_22]HLE10903.1 branch
MIKRPLLTFLALLVVGLAFEFSVNAYIQLTIIYVCVNMILAMSLNLVSGYTGQFSLGHAGFMAIGAYVSAFLAFHFTIFPESLNFLNFIIFGLIAGMVSGFAGWLVGTPSLRLKGDYLAIVTLGFGEIIRVVLLNLETVGGARGYYGIPGFVNYTFAGITLSRFVSGFGVSAFWLVITFFLIYRLVYSSHGRVLISVKEDEVASEAMGINVTRMKVWAFVISSFLAGIAGSLFAHYTNYLNPSTFSFNQSVNVVIMVVLGGMGSLTGSIVAAIIVTLLPELLRPLQEITGVDLRMVIYSFSLILLMILKPNGLFGQGLGHGKKSKAA